MQIPAESKVNAAGISGCIALIVGLSALLAFEGYDKTADRAEWFLFNNVAGACIIFVGAFLYNWFIAPGRLLAREISRELVNEWLTVINGKVAEAGKLIEAIRLGQDMTIAQQEFESWRESTRRFFVERLPRYEPIFDDVELGPFGPLLDLPARLRAISPPGSHNFMESQPGNLRQDLIDTISRRRANLQRIYEGLLPISISGVP